MNEEAWQAALDALRDEQCRLQAHVQHLNARIGELAALRPASVAASPPPLPRPVPPSVPPALPPAAVAALASVPPLLPLKLAPVPTPSGPPGLPVPHEAPPGPVPVAPEKSTDSLEMRVGSYWLVRIGVAILLTGLVFLATYLYQTITPRLGPGGKIALLYLASGTLIAMGAWLTRRSTEPRMRNFAAVVESGGLAAVFFTTYAAHYFPGLQIISSPFVAAGLLLAWSGFIVWLSSRRQSPTLATGAIVLMGYTTAVHPMGTFSLLANLMVVLAAVVLLWRRRWFIVSYAALAASYGGYFYWRIFQHSPWSSRGEFWIELSFLAGYWVLFAMAGFIGTEKEVPPRRRAFLVGLNNSAFFALATLLVVEFHRASFWQFAITFGLALLVLGALCHRRVDGATAGVYRLQGLLLVTLAIVTYFSGWQLGLMLALQTAVLASAASWRCSRVLILSAMLAGLVAVVATLDFVIGIKWTSVILPVSATGTLLLAAAWIARHRPRGETPELYPQWFGAASALFTLFGTGVWFFAMWTRTTPPVLAPALALVAVAMTWARPILRLPLLPFLGQIWFAAAVFNWFLQHGALRAVSARAQQAPWWSSAALVAAALLLGRWWKSDAIQKHEISTASAQTLVRALPALGGVLILGAAVWPSCSPDAWLVVAPLLAIAVVGAAFLLGDVVLGLAAQLLLLASSAALMQAHFARSLPGAGFALFAALAPILLARVGGRLTGNLGAGTRKQVVDLGVAYEILSAFLAALWIFDCLPRPWQPLALAVAAVACFAANRFGAGLRPFYFLAFGAISLATFWLALHASERASVQNLVAIILLALPFAWARRTHGTDEIPADPFRAFALGALALSGWRWVSIAVSEMGGFYLAAAWAIYAAVLLGVGLAARERIYRLGGFLILACTLLRVVADGWRFGMAYRAVSLIVLAGVLLLLGYLYNRFHDKLKEWL